MRTISCSIVIHSKGKSDVGTYDALVSAFCI
jgi:hypothetical protein